MHQYMVVEVNVNRGAALYIKGFAGIDRIKHIENDRVNLWVNQNLADPKMYLVMVSGSGAPTWDANQTAIGWYDTKDGSVLAYYTVEQRGQVIETP